MHKQSRGFQVSSVLAVLLGLMMWAQVAAAQDLASDFRRGFVEGYVRSALKRGDSPQKAQADGNCLYDELNQHLTTSDWVKVLAAGAVRESPPPELRSLLAEAAVHCARLGVPGSSSLPPTQALGPAPPSQSVDDVDTASVTRYLGELRAEEEMQQSTAQGRPVILPTGRCVARVTVGAGGIPGDGFLVRCSDDRMEAVMRRAVIAAAPFRAAAGSTVVVAVAAPNPEPGIRVHP